MLCKALRELKQAELKIAQAFCIPQVPGLDDIVEQHLPVGVTDKKPTMVNNVICSTKSRALKSGWVNPLTEHKEISVSFTLIFLKN